MNYPDFTSVNLRQRVGEKHKEKLRPLFEFITGVGAVLPDLHQDWSVRSKQRVVVLYLFARAFKSAQSIYVLFLNGYEQDAMMLLRGLTETVIDLRYISVKPNPRSTQFMHYGIIGMIRWMDKCKSVNPELHGPPGAEEAQRRVYHELIEKYPEYKKLGNNWSKTGIKTRAEEGNCRELYFYYVTACRNLHTDASNVSKYIQFREEGVHIDAGPKEPQLEKGYIEATYCCLLLAFEVANRVLKWRRGDVVAKYYKKFRQHYKPKELPLTRPKAKN